MSRLLKALPLALALAALSIFAASCGSSGPAQARFVNAVPDTDQYGTGLDIEFNGTKDFTNVAFFDYLPASEHTNVPSGNNTIEGFETATSSEIFSSNVFLNPGSQYTMVAAGPGTNINKIALISAVENNTVPAIGTVVFRVINASPSGPSGVDIYFAPVGSNAPTPPATITNLAYRNTSAYVTLPYNSNSVDGANYTMFVTATGTTTPVLITQSFSAGTSSQAAIRTLVLTDEQNIDQLNPQAIILKDLN
ncbi:MAG: DUF4397 domain-containing protein [Terriglobales bacterium]|jgi:uncharacterized protein DUF4397